MTRVLVRGRQRTGDAEERSPVRRGAAAGGTRPQAQGRREPPRPWPGGAGRAVPGGRRGAPGPAPLPALGPGLTANVCVVQGTRPAVVRCGGPRGCVRGPWMPVRCGRPQTGVLQGRVCRALASARPAAERGVLSRPTSDPPRGVRTPTGETQERALRPVAVASHHVMCPHHLEHLRQDTPDPAGLEHRPHGRGHGRGSPGPSLGTPLSYRPRASGTSEKRCTSRS